MNVARDPMNHMRAHQIVKRALDKREPALITLPLSLPSIPLLDQLLTPLIVGTNHVDATTTTTTTTPSSGTTTTKQNSPTTTVSPNSGTSTTAGNNGQGSGSSTAGGDVSSGSASTSRSATLGGAAASSTGTGTDTSLPGQTLLANAGNQAPSGLVSGLANASAATSYTTVESTIYSNGVAVATHTTVSAAAGSTTTNGASQSGNGSSDDPAGGSTSDADAASKHGVSIGVIIAAIVVGLLCFLGILILYLRKRSVARRSERRHTWWNSAGNNSRRWSSGESGDATLGSGTQSARSSFATTYDQGLGSTLTLDFTNVTPPLPPMAEIRDAHGPGFMLHSQQESPSTPSLISFEQHPELPERRVSVYSNRSSDSQNSQTQYLNVDPFLNDPEGVSPMSVRPFSPSESFAFPKPPSNRASASSKTFPVASIAEGSVPATPALPSTTLPATPSNPFLDPVTAETQTIQRPFSPTLHDEISVEIGDRIRVSKVFDDGWAWVEKYTAEDESKTIQGLIPIDCLRESAQQQLPTFLASKRVSSHGAGPAMAL